MFQLDARLDADTIEVADWPLCTVRLMNDRHYPWVILIPKVEGMSELYQLTSEQRKQLDEESTYLAHTLMDIFAGDKMNVAALGNVVKQLHIHHVVRFETDAAWPAPIWGKVPVENYSQDELTERLAKLQCVAQKQW